MRPIKLEIQGLQSFNEKQTIDFETLTEHGLFGIFGETGSGKSTILDALTLALYGNVVRIKDTKEDKLIHLLNINSDKIMVAYEFFIGEERYYVERTFPKMKNKNELGQSKASFVVNGEIKADKVGEVNNCIGEIIGLSMDDFTRSVVLPQGKFSEFLKLTGKEKRNMLERVFGLEEYGRKLMTKLSGEKNSKEKEVAALDNIILGKGDVSLEELQEKKEEFAKLQDEKKELFEKFEIFMKEYSDKEEVYKLLREKAVLLDEKNSLDSQKEMAENTEEKIRKGEKSFQVIEFFNKLSKCEEDINKYMKKSELLKEELLEKSKEKENLFDILKKIQESEKELMERDKNIDLDPEEYDVVSTGVHIGKTYLELLSELTHLGEKISEEKTNLMVIRENEEENIENLKETEKKLQNLGVEDSGALESIRKKIELLNIERKEVELLEEDVKSLEKYLSEAQKEKLALEKTLLSKDEELKKACEAKEGEIAQRLAKQLKEGEPCPVCGSKTHPHIADDFHGNSDEGLIETIEADKKSIEKKLYRINLEKISSDLENKKIQLKGRNTLDIDSEIEKLKKEFEKIDVENQEIATKKEKLTSLKNQFSTDKTVLTQKKENCQRFLENHKKSERDKIEKKNFIKKQLEETVPDYMSNDLRIEKLEGRLSEIKEIKKEQQKIKKQLAELRSDIRDKSKLQESLNEVIGNIKISQSETNGSLKEKESQGKLYSKEAMEKMESFGFTSKNEVEESFIAEDEMDGLKRWIKEYKDKYEANRISLDNLDIKINGRVITRPQWEIFQKKKIDLENQNKELDSKVLLLEKNLKDMEKLLKEVGDLKNKLAIKKKELGLLEDLSKLFQGNAFVEYLAVSRLKGIVSNAASRLSRITNGKYSLTIDDSANFLIIDNFNGGAKRRSSTLSGGETFLVSLTLALALSNQIQLKGKSQLEFFFLDEGFGTLDSSLLDRVITSLETLKNQEKLKVGIITHVEDIKERVPRKLEVYSAVPGERGTMIEMV
ncbi:SMC family ATPase [uncultured Ilyobacter sp.]|uniref:SMC family ATPase n=1 Tax=uncultured Ilyobacter sp. TaxID=544433 RepID=UPI002AA7F531|nr:SMC family ATPase [uncultured Ilyobacter sp.]